MKILVTGASGLLGTELCRQLKLDSDNEVWAVDNHSRSYTIPLCNKWIKMDLSDPESLNHLPRDFDQIYHYAAINGTKNFYERPNQVLTNNFISDIHVFEFAATCPDLKKLVYPSTSEIPAGETGSISELVDIRIENIHNSRWSYRLAKIASENYLANSSLPYVMIRYYNVYGANDGPGHFLPDQISKIKSGIFEIIGGNETRSFCHVEDACEATIWCANNGNRILINIGNDVETNISEAAKIIANCMGYDNPNWTYLPGRSGSASTRRPDITLLKTLMPHWSPRSFEQGVRQILI